MHLDAEHFTPANFLRHRHLNPSGIHGSADHVISRLQVLHCTLLRSRPTSLRNCIARPSSQERYVRKSLFWPPSWRSIRRLYEALGMNGISCRRFSYSSTISVSFPSIFHCTLHTTGHKRNWTRQLFRREEMLYRKFVALWVKQKKRGENVNGMHV